VPAVTLIPFWNVGAPVPAWLVKKSALTLPPEPPILVIPSVERPKTSGTKSSPSATIRSLVLATTTSAY